MSENNKTHWKYEYGMKVVYVFGSNEAGRHGKGYALVCKKKYGAIQGRGFGLQGMWLRGWMLLKLSKKRSLGQQKNNTSKKEQVYC